MSIRQQLRDSGLFDELREQKSTGSVGFQAKGYPYSTIYALRDDIRFDIRVCALELGRFPNNRKLYDFVRRHHDRKVRGEDNPAHAFQLSGEHISEVIEIVRGA